MPALLYLSLCVIPFVTCLLLSPLMRKPFAAQMDDNGKFVIIDGLRGLAAVSVIIHHGILMTNLFMHADWRINAGYIADFNALVPRILTQLGSFGVTIFFMITGYLFWTKALTHGVGETATFYRRRVYRLLPMYLVAVAGVYLLSSAIGFTANMNGGYLLRSLASWLSFGFINGMSVTDGNPGWLILCGVFWTLAVEVKFYLLFPLLALLARQRVRGLVVLSAVVLVLLGLHWAQAISALQYSILFAFVCGMLTATLHTSPGFKAETAALLSRPGWKYALAAVALGSVGLSFFLFDFAYTGLSALLIAVFFLITASGNDLFGALRCRSLRFGGIISYSSYLLHGLVLTLSFHWIYPHWGPFIALSIAFVAVFILSALTFINVEAPFMQLAHGGPRPRAGRQRDAIELSAVSGDQRP
ncbi:MAG: acyltransferase family protein [Sodalis sp. (in: enterobacteria)]|uniref:acyltransferase family protein n=1 Tax=Sodalis sp. (in: enterobacteria) TaxID=1898979 RepID=UPI003FD81DE0